MWLGFGILGGLLALTAISIFQRSRRTRKRDLDVGSVSAAWLAEHRGKTAD